ncbi:MAG: glutamate--tRNA ligase [Pseudomonadota bacterium]
MKTRFAPSPTGMIHIGNVRTALFNFLLARANRGTFLLRIEDTDHERSKSIYVEQLKKDLRWLELEWQEGPECSGDYGPYFQSQRFDSYDKYYQQLIEAGNAYPCFCSEEALALQRKIQLSSGRPPRYSGKCRALSREECEQKIAQGIKPTLRFKMPQNTMIEFVDMVKGAQKYHSDDIGDFIIRRANGTAAFMFCNAIDDAMMKVTHVLRGDDHLTNTPRQLAILSALKLEAPQYGHLSLIVGLDNAPLSKRNGSRHIQELRDAGFLPGAIVNYMARLGHYYKENNFMSLQELADHFSTDRLNSAPACYDEKQLLHWQKLAVMQLTDNALTRWLGDEPIKKIPVAKQALFFQIIKQNCTFPEEVQDMIDIFFQEMPSLSKQNQLDIQQVGVEFFISASRLVNEHDTDFTALKNGLSQQLGVKGKSLFMPLRLALTGQSHGIDMGSIFNLLGKENILGRLEHAGDIAASN